MNFTYVFAIKTLKINVILFIQKTFYIIYISNTESPKIVITKFLMEMQDTYVHYLIKKLAVFDGFQKYLIFKTNIL